MAAPIVVEVDGVRLQQTWSSGDDVTVNVGNVSTTTLVHIFEDTMGTPTAVIGKVRIEGTAVSGSMARLNVLIAAPTVQYPTSPTTFVDPGASSVGSQGTGSGIVIADDLLRARTVLAISVTDTISGDIVVGQAIHIAARGRFDEFDHLISGDITANITAIAPNSGLAFDPVFVPGADYAIGEVRAGRSISGNITSDHPDTLDGQSVTDAFFGGSIYKVVVGPSHEATGISGDITTKHGAIGAVFSTGPIGKPEGNTKIWAKHGISEIRAIREDGVFAASDIAADFKIDVDGGHGYDAASSVAFPRPATGRIETRGSITGTINAYSFGPGAGVQGFGGVPAGIYAHGDILSDIKVETAMSGSILGRTIQGSIRVGYFFEGAIIATALDDPSTPPIPSIEIGLGPYGNEPPFPSDVLATNNRGFIGGDSFTVHQGDLRNPEVIENLYRTGTSEDAAASVIAARAVNAIRISVMSAFEIEPEETAFEQSIPKIEVGAIGTLEIGTMREGVVWSGRLDPAPIDPETNLPVFPNVPSDTDRSDDYTTMFGDQAAGSPPAVRIGCLGLGADVWVTGFNRFRVERSLVGEIHVPNLPAGTSIAVGGGMDVLGEGHVPTDCHCAGVLAGSPFGCIELTTDSHWLFPGFTSPRDERELDQNQVPLGTFLPAAAGIFIDEKGGLSGQIIVNAANTNDSWTSPSRVWVGPAPDRVGLDNLYPHLASFLGGGAAGTVPFHVKFQDCQPHPATDLARYVYTSSFNSSATPGQGVPIRVSFYGPVTSVSASTVQFTRVDDPNYVVPAYVVGIVANSQDDQPMGRDIEIRPAAGSVFEPGAYRVTILGAPANGTGVRCDLGLGLSSNPPVIGSDVDFTLSARCLNEGSPYPADLADDAGHPLWPHGIGGVGPNVNSGVNEGDYNAFFAGYFTALAYCDIADDAGNDLFAGTAGLNNGVNEGDYNLFFQTFFAGCP